MKFSNERFQKVVLVGLGFAQLRQNEPTLNVFRNKLVPDIASDLLGRISGPEHVLQSNPNIAVGERLGCLYRQASCLKSWITTGNFNFRQFSVRSATNSWLHKWLAYVESDKHSQRWSPNLGQPVGLNKVVPIGG